jgi:hypothetical protein
MLEMKSFPVLSKVFKIESEGKAGESGDALFSGIASPCATRKKIIFFELLYEIHRKPCLARLPRIHSGYKQSESVRATMLPVQSAFSPPVFFLRSPICFFKEKILI